MTTFAPEVLDDLTNKQQELIVSLIEDLADNMVIDAKLVDANGDEIKQAWNDEIEDVELANGVYEGRVYIVDEPALVDSLAVLGLALVPISLLGENIASKAYFDAITGSAA